MKTFIFTNTQRTINKEYKTDFITGMSNFTVHDVKVYGNATEDQFITLGVNFKQEPHTLQEFKALAESLNLALVENDFQAGTNTEIVAETTVLAVTTAALDGAMEGVAELTTVTIPATAAATQGDYFIINNYSGESFAIWLDIDDAGTTPTGANFIATDYQIKVGIATGDLTTDTATKAKTAIELDANWTGFDTITDLGTGALEITASDLGSIANATVSNAAEDGAGSITVAISPNGSGEYSFQLASEGGIAPYTYELDTTSDPLVAGLTLSSAGLISGVATTTGTPTLVFKVTDSFGQTALSAGLVLTVST